MDLNLIPYNTGLDHLVLPEYGRTVQDMVRFCCSIENRDERTACANSIVDTLARLFPKQVGPNGDKKKLWDEINIISGFSLDIDFPVEVATAESLHPTPAKIPYSGGLSHHRQYGNNILRMIDIAAGMEPGPERDALILRLAHYIKRILLANNSQGVTDAKIFADIAELSMGRIVLNPSEYRLRDIMQEKPAIPKKNKKKRRRY